MIKSLGGDMKKLFIILSLLLSLSIGQNYSLSFDGESYVNCGNVVGGLSTQSYEISFKPRIDILSGTLSVPQGLLTSRYDEPSSSLFIMDDGKIRFQIYPSINGLANVSTTRDTWLAGNWYHITATFDGETHKIYVNGILENSTNGTHDYCADNDLIIGGSWQPTHGYHYQFDGMIDNVRIWDYALDSTQIQSYMSIPPAANEEGLVGYWSFNAGEGTTLYDHSVNGNDGTIHEAAWSTDVPPIEGCTHPNATNYDDTANVDDGSCCIELWGECYNIEEMTFLSLSNYNLTGSIPPEIGYLTNLTNIWLQNNQLTGSIPPEIGYLTNLTQLYLGSNQLTGEIPVEIGNLINLTDLWVSNNQLTGEIPGAVCALIQNNNFNINDILQGNNLIYTCEAPLGCTDSSACNFDSDATLDDGSCEYNSGIWYVSVGGDNSNCGSGEFPLSSIQLAIDSSMDGDTILVSAGTYYENIHLNNKSLAIIGDEDMNTIISAPTLTIYSDEEKDVTYSNLKIYSNGIQGRMMYLGCSECRDDEKINVIFNNIEFDGYDERSAIALKYNYNVIINNSVFINLEAGGDDGGAIHLSNSGQEYNHYRVLEINNTIFNNCKGNRGAGIYSESDYSIISINKSLFVDNYADLQPGGALSFWNQTQATINSSTFYNNYSNAGSGTIYSEANSTITNSIIYSDSVIFITGPIITGPISITYSNISYGYEGIGNLDNNPQFTDPENGDFTLQSTSPCIDAGDPLSELDPDGTRADMGAYSYEQYQNSINLHEGANLISFYAIPKDNSVANVLSSLGDNAEGIIGEGVAASNIGSTWVGSLTEIESTSGYWLKLGSSDELNLTGFPLAGENELYTLHEGANLVSYPYESDNAVSAAIPDLFEGYIEGLIGEGVAAVQTAPGNWVGSLTEFERNKGYWLKSSSSFTFAYDQPTEELVRSIANNSDKDFNQSTEQAFYFIENIENIEVGDMVSSYCNDTKVGSRAWNGSYTDIPAMGKDNSDLTKDYCTSSSIPTFRVEKANGETYALTGDIPVWESNGLHMLSSLQEAIILPESYSLAAAYPNPFNPTTTINFAIPTNAEVSIAIYNLQGREVVSLVNGSYDAGYHQVIWNADSYSSGVYFVKMVAGSYVNTQKLMLVK
jgi:hypothetical protein